MIKNLKQNLRVINNTINRFIWWCKIPNKKILDIIITVCEVILLLLLSVMVMFGDLVLILTIFIIILKILGLTSITWFWCICPFIICLLATFIIACREK